MKSCKSYSDTKTRQRFSELWFLIFPQILVFKTRRDIESDNIAGREKGDCEDFVPYYGRSDQ